MPPLEEVTSPRRVANLHASGCHGPAELGGSEPAAANLDDLAERARSEDGFSVNFERPVLGCIDAKFFKWIVNPRLKALDESYKIYTLLDPLNPIWKP